jgi:hypothetical protein
MDGGASVSFLNADAQLCSTNMHHFDHTYLMKKSFATCSTRRKQTSLSGSHRDGQDRFPVTSVEAIYAVDITWVKRSAEVRKLYRIERINLTVEKSLFVPFLHEDYRKSWTNRHVQLYKVDVAKMAVMYLFIFVDLVYRHIQVLLHRNT